MTKDDLKELKKLNDRLTELLTSQPNDDQLSIVLKKSQFSKDDKDFQWLCDVNIAMESISDIWERVK